MPATNISVGGSIAGITIQGVISRNGEGQVGAQVVLPAAQAGTLKTRTGDNEGTFTVTGHAFQVNDIVDIYWTGGVRYGMKVTAVDGNDFTAGGVGGPGAGDNLPAQEGTAIVADEQVEVDIDFDGDLMTLVVVHSPRRANVDFVDSGGVSLKVIRLTANEPWIWADGQGFTRPITGNPVDKAKVSNGDSQNAATLTIGVRLDSVS